METLVQCSQFFDRLAEMVPAKYFIDNGKFEETGNQFWHSKSVKAQKRQQAANAGKLHKKSKLDPDNAKSTVDAQKVEYEERKSRGRVATSTNQVPLSSQSEDEMEDVQFQKLNFNVNEGFSAEDGKKKKKSKQALLKEAFKNKKQKAIMTKDDSAWDDAFKRAHGEKIVDDPTKIAKAIRREQKDKQKRKAKWEERKRENDEKRDAKQKKRKENLKDRTAKKIERRIAKKQNRRMNS